jgi:hypothetical protein
MKSMDIQPIEQDARLAGSYIFTIRVALIFLLLGGGCLALAKFFPWSKASGDRLIVAHLAEVVGWSLLALTEGTLFRKLIGRKALSDAGFSERSSAIDDLYAELRPLMSRAVADPRLKDEVQRKLSVLRRLQVEEADEMEKRFEAGLLLKPGEGWQALERAREILARYEDPATPDAPAPR